MIKLKLKKKTDHSYNIIIKQDIEDDLINTLKDKYENTKACIIADSHVSKLYGKELVSKLKKNGIIAELISFPRGESYKNLKTVEKICSKMVKAGFTRKDIIIAMGGGVSGDIGGFVASIYMRGIPFIQIPTSLLAMVDSSIGGKTGVDLPEGKNLIGTFNQPECVLIGTKYLKTLSSREFNNGMSEIIKHAIIRDKNLFRLIEKKYEKILDKDESTMVNVINRSCVIKINIVQKDETEQNVRMLLNYGHTIGHALETLSKFKLKHGEAISIGIMKENNLSKKLKQKQKDRIKKMFESFKLPTDHSLCKNTKDILELIKNDKKRHQSKLPHFAIPIKIGKAELAEFTSQEITKALKC